MPQSPKSQGTIVAHVAPNDRFGMGEIERIARALPQFQVIAVQDGTSAQFEPSGAIDNLRAISLPTELGRGAAQRAGFNESNDDLVAFAELGGSLDPRDIRSYFERLTEDPSIDGIVGNRFTGRASGGAADRRFATRAFGAFGKLLFGLRSADPQASLKVFRREAILRIFGGLRSYNQSFDVELLFQAKRAGLRLIDAPLAWSPGPRPWSVWKAALPAAASLVALRLLNSPLRRLPFVDLLGRTYALPVKSRYSIMIFCWRDPANPQSGGSETYLLEQARHWVAHGHRVTWFAQRFRGSKAREEVEGIEFVRRGSFPFVFLWGALWYALGSHREFDFIIDCMNGIPFFTPLFSSKPKVCLLYHVHSHHFSKELPRPIGALASFVETRVVPRIYRRTPFVTISESTRTEMERLHMTDIPIGLVYSGIDAVLAPGRKAASPTVLYLGRLKRYKRVRKLIDAFVLVRSSVPNARLVIAGAGDDEEGLRAYAKACGADGIEFAGRVSDEEKTRLMQEAWVFGMPSSIEGWGIVVTEANACGTPALVYDVNGLRDCVQHGNNGLVVRTDEEYAAGLQRLLTDADLRDRLSRGALEWAKKFSWAGAAEQTLLTIRSLQPWSAVFEPSAKDRWSLVFRPSAEPSNGTSPISGKRVSVVMPAFNESELIARNLREVVATFERFDVDFEVILVDDGSHDNTHLQALRVLIDHPERVRILRYEVNQGKGNALMAGALNARGDYVVFLDSDMDIHPAQLPVFFETMEKRSADAVIGSKRHPQSRVKYPPIRQIYSTGYYGLVRTLFGLPLRDTQTGLKLFRRSVLADVLPRVMAKRFAFDIEMLAIAHHLGYRIVDAPVVLGFNRRYGRINYREVWRIFLDTLAIFYRLRLLRYYDTKHDVLRAADIREMSPQDVPVMVESAGR